MLDIVPGTIVSRLGCLGANARSPWAWQARRTKVPCSRCKDTVHNFRPLEFIPATVAAMIALTESMADIHAHTKSFGPRNLPHWALENTVVISMPVGSHVF